MPYILREAQLDDIEPLQHLLTQAHKGITNLPYDTSSTKEKIHLSIASFEKKLKAVHDEFYLFILEDTKTKKRVGLSGVKATTGTPQHPALFFMKTSEEHTIPPLRLSYTLNLLSTVSYVHGPTEVCSLFLDESHRGKGIGSLLSLGRFLYMANHSTRFTDHIIAELRGVIHKDGFCPFYEGVGRYFFRLSYIEALKQFAPFPSLAQKLLPSYPLYLDMLPTAARHALGTPHEDTERALHLLKTIGFSISNEYDIFDGGPKLIAKKQAITPFAESQRAVVLGALPAAGSYSTLGYVATGPHKSFKATKGLIQVSQSGDEIGLLLEKEIIDAIEVKEGDTVRFWAPSSTRNSIKENS